MGLLRKLSDANPDDDFEPSTPDDLPPVPDDPPAQAAAVADKSAEPNPANNPEIDPSVYVLREILRAYDWPSDPSQFDYGSEDWEVIRGMLDITREAGYRDVLQEAWQEFVPAGYPTLEQMLAGPQASADERADLTTIDYSMAQTSTRPSGLPEKYYPFYNPEADRTIDVDAQWVEGDHNYPHRPFAAPWTRPVWPHRSTMPQPPTATSPPSVAADAHPGNGAEHAQQAQPGGGGAGGGMLDKILKLPFTAAAMAGSAALASAGVVRSYYMKQRINGHSVLAQQLDQSAMRVEGLANSLREQGMGDLVRNMKAEGRSAREIFSEMRPGGEYEKYLYQFNDLMKRKDFAETHAELIANLDEFNGLATRYAKTGVDLNADYSDAIDRNLEKISAATEGLIFNKDGAVRHLQEMARQIGDRVAEMLQKVLGRFAPR